MGKLVPVKFVAKYNVDIGWCLGAQRAKPVDHNEFTIKTTFQPSKMINENIFKLRNRHWRKQWLQFEPKEWKDVIEKTFNGIIKSYSGKRANKDSIISINQECDVVESNNICSYCVNANKVGYSVTNNGNFPSCFMGRKLKECEQKGGECQ